MTETQGEKELILGNKQLISLFFVVVALCGVCFAMGYIIGRNSSKPAAAADAPQPQAAAPAHAQDTEPPRQTSEAASDAGSASPAAQGPAQVSPAAQPSDSPAAVSNGAPANDPVVTRPGRDVAQPARATEAETSPVSTSPAPQPGGGSYLQVGAVSKVDAENLVRTLKEQKLPAMMAESPKRGLFRVLVGPYRQTADLAEAKSRLKTLGFDNAFVQR
jgi:DedD protein